MRSIIFGVVFSILLALVFLPFVVGHLEIVSFETLPFSQQMMIYGFCISFLTFFYFFFQYGAKQLKEKNWNNHVMNMLFELIGGKSFLLVALFLAIFYWVFINVLFKSPTITNYFVSILK